MPRSMLAIPQLQPVPSGAAAGFHSVSKALQLMAALQARNRADSIDQQKVNDEHEYRQGQLKFQNRQLDTLDADRDEARRLAADSRRDLLDEKTSDNERDTLKWMAQNRGGSIASPDEVAMGNRRHMGGIFEDEMTLPSRQLSGIMSGLPASQQDPDALPPTQVSPVVGRMQEALATGQKKYGLTMDDKMRAAQMTADQKARDLDFKQSQLDANVKRFDADRESKESIAEARARARVAEMDAAAARAGGAQSLARDKFKAAEDAKKEKLDAKKSEHDQKVQKVKSDVEDTVMTLDRLIDHPGLSGIVGNKIPYSYVPGSDSANALALFNNIEARNVINTVTEMKSLSANGSTGFGALSEKEGEYLKNSRGALDRKQSVQEWKTNAQKLANKYRQAAGFDQWDYVNRRSIPGTGTASRSSAGSSGSTKKTYIPESEF